VPFAKFHANNLLLQSALQQDAVSVHLRSSSSSSSSSSSFLTRWHVLLGVRSAIRRHQPPQRAVLSQVKCFVQCEVVGSQIALDRVQPRDARMPWWSLPVIWNIRDHSSDNSEIPTFPYPLPCRAPDEVDSVKISFRIWCEKTRIPGL